MLPAICLMCKWKEPIRVGVRDIRCSAFPDGVPEEIEDGGNDHSKPLANEGYLFEPADWVTDEDLSEWHAQKLDLFKAFLQIRIPPNPIDGDLDW